MTKEGLSPNPAPEKDPIETLDSIKFTTQFGDKTFLSYKGGVVHEFVRAAYQLDRMQQNLGAMSKTLRSEAEERLKEGEIFLGIADKRNTRAFGEVVNQCAQKLEESDYPHYWFGEAPKGLETVTDGVLFDHTSENIHE